MEPRVNSIGQNILWTILWMKSEMAAIYKLFQRCLADAMEALRQHVDQEPADELVRRQRHRFPAAEPFDAIVLPAERHATIISGDQPAVRDGDAMGVAREIAQDLLWPGERLFAVDDPLGWAQRCQELLEGSLVGEADTALPDRLQLAGKPTSRQRERSRSHSLASQRVHLSRSSKQVDGTRE
jgi:hypothetical protein